MGNRAGYGKEQIALLRNKRAQHGLHADCVNALDSRRFRHGQSHSVVQAHPTPARRVNATVDAQCEEIQKPYLARGFCFLAPASCCFIFLRVPSWKIQRT